MPMIFLVKTLTDKIMFPKNDNESGMNFHDCKNWTAVYV